VAFIHGSKAIVKLDNAANALTDISTYVRSITFSRSADLAEVSVMGNTSKKYITGLKDGQITLEGPWDAVIDTQLNDLLGNEAVGGAGVHADLEYYPEGTATGKRKYSMKVVHTTFEPASPVDDAATWSAEFQVDGDVTVGVVP